MQAPARLPLVTAVQNRDSTLSKDARLINCFAELDPQLNEYIVEKRLGLATQSTLSGNGYGTYNWNNDIYVVAGTTFYKNGVSQGTVDAGSGVYRFTPVRGAPPFLFLGNGRHTYYTDGTTLNEITNLSVVMAGYFLTGTNYTILTVGTTDFTLIGSVNNNIGQGFVATGPGTGTGTAVALSSFPGRSGAPDPIVPLAKGFAYLDGTLYVMDLDANIYGTKYLDSPLYWDPLNKIVARIEPDKAVALAKHLVYVIAFKQWTTEAFYDAANATGSPLAPVQGAKVELGCVSADSVQEIDGTLLWITTNRASSPQVARMDNLQVTVVSTPPIDRFLAQADYTTVYSFQIKIGGHSFYGITIKNSNVTLVYDLGQQLWYPWTDGSSNYWPIVAGTFDSSYRHLLQHETNGKVYYGAGDYTYPNDDGVVIPVDIYTPNFDGSVDRRKNLKIMRFNADQTSGSKLLVRYSEDDYQTWSRFREVNLSNKRPILIDCGTFYRRAYHFRHFANTGFRIRTVDLQVDLGTL